MNTQNPAEIGSTGSSPPMSSRSGGEETGMLPHATAAGAAPGQDKGTDTTRAISRLMLTPAVALLLVWMIVPLVLTLWFSTQRYNLFYPDRISFVWLANYMSFVTDPVFFRAILNTGTLVVGVLLITVLGGIGIAVILDRPMWGQGVVRIMTISPFFIMPPVAALVWKNMFMNPTNGLFAAFAKAIGQRPFDFFGHAPMLSLIIIVAWQWLPFATLIILTALQSLDRERMEAAEMDGASAVQRFWYIAMPHLARAITVVILIQTIFLLGIFGEILVTTNGGPGTASTTLTFMIYKDALLDFDAGTAAAGGIVAVIIANIVAIFLMRAVGKNLDT